MGQSGFGVYFKWSTLHYVTVNDTLCVLLMQPLVNAEVYIPTINDLHTCICPSFVCGLVEKNTNEYKCVIMIMIV